MGRVRSVNLKLPRNLYCRNGYYSYRHPITRVEHGLGRVRNRAVVQANAANRRVAANTISGRISEGLLNLRTAEEIVSAAVLNEQLVGVYFLIKGVEIVYVGQTRSGHGRIVTHARNGEKSFDRFHFIPCAAPILDELEATYIEAFRPLYNHTTYPLRARGIKPISIQVPEISDRIVK